MGYDYPSHVPSTPHPPMIAVLLPSSQRERTSRQGSVTAWGLDTSLKAGSLPLTVETRPGISTVREPGPPDVQRGHAGVVRRRRRVGVVAVPSHSAAGRLGVASRVERGLHRRRACSVRSGGRRNAAARQVLLAAVVALGTPAHAHGGRRRAGVLGYPRCVAVTGVRGQDPPGQTRYVVVVTLSALVVLGASFRLRAPLVESERPSGTRGIRFKSSRARRTTPSAEIAKTIWQTPRKDHAPHALTEQRAPLTQPQPHRTAMNWFPLITIRLLHAGHCTPGNLLDPTTLEPRYGQGPLRPAFRPASAEYKAIAKGCRSSPQAPRFRNLLNPGFQAFHIPTHPHLDRQSTDGASARGQPLPTSPCPPYKGQGGGDLLGTLNTRRGSKL